MTRLAAAGFLLLLATAGALAQTPPPAHVTPQVAIPAKPPAPPQPLPAYVHQPACMPDVKRFCSKVKLGQGRVRACLQAHRAQLVPVCVQKLDWYIARKAQDKANAMAHKAVVGPDGKLTVAPTAPAQPSTPPKH
jgi:hypothetical protein